MAAVSSAPCPSSSTGKELSEVHDLRLRAFAFLWFLNGKYAVLSVYGHKDYVRDASCSWRGR